MQNIVLFGAGGLARETVHLIDDINRHKPSYRLLGFIVEEKYYKANSMVGGYPVLGTEEWIIANKDNVVCTCAIGFPEPRARIQKALQAQGVRFESLISPDTRIRDSSVVGKGCIILNSSISVDCSIGDGVLLNGDIGMGHDVSIGNYTCIMQGTKISGWISIGEEVFIGGNSYIVPKRKIGDHAVVAAGSVVFTNVKPNTTVLGNPAKRIPSLED